jgi:uncharacterized membrane protein
MIFDSPLERVFMSWRDPERLARSFDFLESVEDNGSSFTLHYRGFLGKKRDLQLSITEDVHERCLAWRGEMSNLGVCGSVAFDARGAQTYVTFVLAWRPPLGRVGDIIGAWVGFPMKPLREGLRRLETISQEPL